MGRRRSATSYAMCLREFGQSVLPLKDQNSFKAASVDCAGAVAVKSESQNAKGLKYV